MYSYSVQQQDVEILKQNVRIIYCKIEILNLQRQVINTIEGNIIDDNFSCDGESAIRRTYTCDILVTDASFEVGKDSNIWADKLIRVHYGIKHTLSGDIFWYLLGTFSFVDLNYTYSTTQKTLSLTCSDLMAFYDGTKSGVMVYNTKDQVTFQALAGQSYGEVLAGLCEHAGITNLLITGVDDYVIPYDQQWGSGATFFDAWKKLCDIYGAWEFFFDEEGRFIWRKVATGLGEDVILDDAVLKPLIISESLTDSFTKIYNCTEVWGQDLDIVDDDRYTEECTGGTSESDQVYHITLENFEYEVKIAGDHLMRRESDGLFVLSGYEATNAYDSFYVHCTSLYDFQECNNLEELKDMYFTTILVNSEKRVVFRDDSCSTKEEFLTKTDDVHLSYAILDNFTDIAIKVSGAYGKYININNTIDIPILNSEGSEMLDTTYVPDTIYVFRHRRTATGSLDGTPYLNFYLRGQFKAHGYYEETDPNVPYSVPNLGYRSVQVLENSSWYSDEVCQDRAKFETYKATVKQDSISLELMIIPFLEPSQKIRYTPFSVSGTDEWVIKNFAWSTKVGTMSLSAHRFLQDYSHTF